eukprot:scaffold77695_cov30-Tisochrysis_lutea.AAC.2
MKLRPFKVASGVPQGCPLSPLVFLLTAKALTRVLNEDDDIEGILIKINGAELKISQFADDTQLLAADYNSLAHLFESCTASKIAPRFRYRAIPVLDEIEIADRSPFDRCLTNRCIVVRRRLAGYSGLIVVELCEK